jgi:hypothetical protein
MVDTNGNVKQADFYKEMKDLREDIYNLRIVLAETNSKLTVGVSERGTLKEAINSLTQWKELTDDRIDELESKDKRFIALVGAGSAVIASLMTIIGHILLGL